MIGKINSLKEKKPSQKGSFFFIFVMTIPSVTMTIATVAIMISSVAMIIPSFEVISPGLRDDLRRDSGTHSQIDSLVNKKEYPQGLKC